MQIRAILSWSNSYCQKPLLQRASLVAQMVKNLPAMQEICIRSVGQEEPLEKGMATHSSILAWIIPWTEGGGWWATVLGVAESDTTEWLILSLFPLQNLPWLSLPTRLYSQSWSCTPGPSELGPWFTYTLCPALCCSHVRALPRPSALHCAQASYYLQCSPLDFILKTLKFLLETSLEP